MGLYVRDAAGLRPATPVEVPRLEPAVELRAGLAPPAVPAASEQWARWWEAELTRLGETFQGAFRPDVRFGDGDGDGDELDALSARAWTTPRGGAANAAARRPRPTATAPTRTRRPASCGRSRRRPAARPARSR